MTFMRQFFKAVGYLALLLFALGASAITALVLANWRDDPPSEAVRQLQQMPPTDAMQEGNGYLIMAGLSAPIDSGNPASSAEAFGRHYLAKMLEARLKARQEPQSFDVMMDGAAFTDEDRVSRFTFDCPRSNDEDCFSWALAHKNEVLALVEANGPLLVRYEAAAMAPQYINPPHDIFNPIPSYTQLRSVHALMLAKAAVQWPHSAENALDTMESTSRLRARIGNSANSWLEASVVLKMQSAELRWISQAMGHAHAHTSPLVSARIRQLIVQPSPNLDSALRGEQQLIVGLLPFMSPKREYGSWREELHDKLLRFGFLPIATTNASLEQLDQIKTMGNLPATALEAAFKTYNQAQADHYRCFFPTRLRNHIGICSLDKGSQTYQKYFQSVHDMDGYRRLIMLQQLAFTQNIQTQDLHAWLQTSPAELRNPYTLQPMQWDAATNSLIFEGNEPRRENLNGSATYRIPMPKFSF